MWHRPAPSRIGHAQVKELRDELARVIDLNRKQKAIIEAGEEAKSMMRGQMVGTRPG